ncbi:glycosyl hydrolase 115 family protein [Mariniflexile soesokkakense]|uniref:Glycosyl hydrolase 115 family protein n=1 Tax=Mariniflexile soesokkakense TaxID=1343160 RepID=A0ABV0A856_9FLAO
MNYLVFICSLFLGYTITPKNPSTENTNTNKLPGFEIFTSQNQAIILYNKNNGKLDSISAHLLAEDIFKVTNYKPEIITNIKQAKGNVIVIGTINSKLITSLLGEKAIKAGFENQWESFLYKTILNPTKKIKKAFIIAGTNPRGTAYGVFNISKKIGVNPWYWWADVPVKKRSELVLNQPDFYSKAPSVKYRGIFLNDEDWGLQPWAAKTFEPETGDIGPKTYSKIFELLLRLNANTIWPAMHPSTKAFFYYPDNAKVANQYQIVVGTSHAEPMLRNNVDEWDKNNYGDFNYKTNKTNVLNYWETRVKEAKNIDAIYTIGMRGVHDSGMEGVKNNDEAVAVLDNVITDQRNLLKKHINPNIENIPQAFTVYKEVLDLYKNGLQVPDDITLVWTDDNYGYIRALSNSEEQKRKGGSGVYYHASYWGRPHDYLWLSSTNPYLIQEEMMKAYNLDNKNIWILNIGDIKPLEYNMQLFLDMAYDADKFQNSTYITSHQNQFYGTIFGNKFAEDLTKIKTNYYKLAFERKPEFMGWSQTEPTTQIFNTAYNTFSNGDEIQQRIDAYETIEKGVDLIENQLSENLKSAFFQLVSYPIQAASNINKKFLYRDKAINYAKQGRKSAKKYKTLSNEAYNNIETLTKEYNQLSNGKWQGMMDMRPRKLPVFDNPSIELPELTTTETIGFSIEDTLKSTTNLPKLPTFYTNDNSSYFIDVFLKNAEKCTWTFNDLPHWIIVSKASGNLVDSKVMEDRIYVSMDWDAWKKAGEPISDIIKLQLNSEKKNIQINTSNSYNNIPKNSIVEKNGLVIIYANHFSKNKINDNLKWKEITGFGHTQAVMASTPLSSNDISNYEETAVLHYELFTETVAKNAFLTLVAIPSHPITTGANLKIGVQWNNDPITILDFKTEGRSNTWKQNVLRNKAEKQIQVSIPKKGKQTLKIYMMSAGVMLDYFVLNTENKTSIPYKFSSETIINEK